MFRYINMGVALQLSRNKSTYSKSHVLCNSILYVSVAALRLNRPISSSEHVNAVHTEEKHTLRENENGKKSKC